MLGALDTVYISRVTIHGKIENQEFLGRILIYMISFPSGYFPNIFWNIHLVFQFCCTTNVFIAAKFVVTILSCFFKHWRWLNRISLFSLFLFEFLTKKRDWKFILIRIFNNRRCFLDELEMCLITNIFLKYILFIYIVSFVYFWMLMIN